MTALTDIIQEFFFWLRCRLRWCMGCEFHEECWGDNTMTDLERDHGYW